MFSDNLYGFEDKLYLPNNRSHHSIVHEFYYSNGYLDTTRILTNLLLILANSLVPMSHDESPKKKCIEPYVLLKNVIALHEFITNNEDFKSFVLSPEYDKLRKQYPARFPVFA